ncbi:Uu.00g058180.m01.CDS01 [Anthostomella pinea]|uniref:Uu.00g058180.m01.CDS01 n=1 Tax=Anthostomella pinea TaxID=933095 RepID=A0AAI8YM43_9PEZI|nr:Uu.00g058180.m01.CDS01 [Anthostomella pinea]
MGSQRSGRGSSTSLSKKTGNKLHRQSLYVKRKQDNEKEKRESRFRRKKEEDREPELRRARVGRNQPTTIDKKRVWDDVDDDSLGANVDMEKLLKRRGLQQEEEEQAIEEASEDDEKDSMLGVSDDEGSEDESAAAATRARQVLRDDSLAPSTTSTNLDLTPQSLVAKFPLLFDDDNRPEEPKVLITTDRNATIHKEAQLLCTLFPNSNYVPRSAHRDKRATEKSVQGADGQELKGVESIRTGLQELGPRCTLKLRRIDKGIGRAGSQGDDAVQWEWKAKMEKTRTRFNL